MSIRMLQKKISSKKLHQHGGFTMIEILIVVGIAAIIFAFSAPYSLNFYRTQLVEEARSNVIDAMQRARHNAILQKNDSNFGVTMSEVEDSYVIFQGASYALRDDTQDEVFPVLSDITFTDLTDVVFSKLTGEPDTTGTTTITYGSISRGILVEESGTISKVDLSGDGEGEEVVPPPEIPTDGLVSYWSLDGDALDDWGSNDGSCTDCPDYGESYGVAGQGADFNGSGDYIDINNNIKSTLVSEFTLSLWINPSNWLSGSSYATVFGGWGLGGAAESGVAITYYPPSSILYVEMSTPTVYAITVPVVNVPVDKWTLLTLSKDGVTGDALLYIDGEYFNEINVPSDILWGYSPAVRLGLSGRGVSQGRTYFNGLMDEIRIYDRALTQEEITTIYNTDAP